MSRNPINGQIRPTNRILSADGRPVDAPRLVLQPGEIPISIKAGHNGTMIALIIQAGQANPVPVPFTAEQARALGTELIGLARELDFIAKLEAARQPEPDYHANDDLLKEAIANIPC